MHSRVHPDWNCASETFTQDNGYEARVGLYADNLGDALGDPIEIAPGVTIHQFWNGLVVTIGPNTTILPDASILWPVPECRGDLCSNCDGRGHPKRAPKHV